MSVLEIAKRAGVSAATVSRVLNNNPSVNPLVVAQVREVLTELDYDPNAIRRGPKIGRRQANRVSQLSIVSVGAAQEDWFRRPVYAAVVAGITRAAKARGFRIHIDEIVENGANDAISRIGSSDGVIAFVASSANPKLLESLCKRLPVVRVMGELTSTPAVDQVRPDNLAIGALAFDYLSKKVDGQVALVTTRPDHEAFLLRAMGFAIAATKAKRGSPINLVTCAEANFVLPGLESTQYAGLDTIADAIASASPKIRGLFVTQDSETIGLYPMLAQRGVIPGRDIEIVSCNNEVSSLSMLQPRPASIEVGADEIGRWAMTRLVNRIARPGEAPIRIMVAPSLVTEADIKIS